MSDRPVLPEAVANSTTARRYVEQLEARAAEAEARIEAAAAIHRPESRTRRDGTTHEVCIECSPTVIDYAPWPCPTECALTGEADNE